MSLLDIKPGSVSTNKSSGLLVAAIVFIGGFLRITIPSGSGPVTPPSFTLQTKPTQSSQSAAHENVFAKAIAAKIKESFGCVDRVDASASPDSFHWNVPKSSRGKARFIVALLPDPAHTHLSLLFDRDVEAMELAVPQISSKVGDASQNFVFDRAILPWRIPSHESSGAAAAADVVKARTDRELFPGLLIFRRTGNGEMTSAKSPDSQSCPARETLFVFLVAETPTSGIRSEQFQNALMIMNAIRGAPEPGANEKSPPLLLLGPNFSGSLDSLARQLKQILPSQRVSDVVAYSGSITGAKSVNAFRQSFLGHVGLKVRFASFQESDEYALQMFARFAFCRGYSPNEIAVLSEADTVYGNQAQSLKLQGGSSSGALTSSTACNELSQDKKFADASPGIVYLNFPREIAYFRSAYEKQLASQAQNQARFPGKSTLPVETGDDGNDDYAVAHYANGQTSLSQEAIMLGLVSELQKHHVKFTVLLATNPVDQVFLARYLRANYPQGRIVVTSPDLMLASQEDTLLSGVLGLNDYSLVPGLGDSLCHVPPDAETSQMIGKHVSAPHVDRLFDSSISIGVYNSMLALVSIAVEKVDPASFANSDFVPSAPYAAYASPALAAANGDPVGCQPYPFLWLTILGRDGY